MIDKIIDFLWEVGETTGRFIVAIVVIETIKNIHWVGIMKDIFPYFVGVLIMLWASYPVYQRYLLPFIEKIKEK